MDILEFAARSGVLDSAKDHLVLLLKSFQLFLPFFIKLLELFHSIRPTSHRYSHARLDDPVVTLASTVLGNM